MARVVGREAGGGESFRTVRRGFAPVSTHCWPPAAGETVVVVSHVTPIKILVADALGAPLDAVYRMELSPASVTVLVFSGAGGW